jgi:hypothetical protein
MKQKRIVENIHAAARAACKAGMFPVAWFEIGLLVTWKGE